MKVYLGVEVDPSLFVKRIDMVKDEDGNLNKGMCPKFEKKDSIMDSV